LVSLTTSCLAEIDQTGERPMSQPSADQNLLFGIIALQMDFITRDALIAAMHAWVLEKAKSLGDILAEQGVLALDERQLLEALVRKHLERHGEDAGRSLSALSPVGWIRLDLEPIADLDLAQSLTRVAEPVTPTEADVTKSFAGSLASQPGQRFRILRPHARGGLGEVHVARDEELNREVALKQIQPTYADHPESRARFLQEAEVTGGLEHPGVVPVYGLGHFDDGRPFYAMRFIRGDSLKEAIGQFHRDDGPGRDTRERSLAQRRLLGRFIDVCNAVAYAHSRGVLHRDLKPGNIMLGPYGETLVVDWGLAKTIGKRQSSSPSRDEATLRPSSGSGYEPTRMGSVVGTPAYMSPEQAEGRLDDLGPASDVYSLGATLYCLLTGRAPIEGSDAAEIMEKARGGKIVSPREIKPLAPRALEAVCLKAMARLPEQRYASPEELAGDIESWLADEPVSAAPDPWWTRLRRWTRRHKTLVAGGAAMIATALLALAGGFVAVSIQKRETERHRVRAEANFRKASDAVERLLTRVGNERLKDVPLMESLRGELLEDALQFQRGFLADRGDDPDVLLGVARVARLAADLQVQLNRLDQAEQSCRQALGIVDELVARAPHNVKYRRERGWALDVLGLILATLDRTEEAEAAYRKAIDLGATVLAEGAASVEDRWRLAVCLDHIGVLLRGAGRWDEAEQFLNRGRGICETNPRGGPVEPRIRRELAAILGHLGLVLTDRGRRAEALENYARAVLVQKAVIAEAPGSSADRELLIVILGNQANELALDGQAAAAERALVEAREASLRLKNDYPAIARFQELAATVLNNLANGLRRNPARDDETRALLNQAISIQEGLVAMAPGVPNFRSKLAQMYDSLGIFLRARNALGEADTVFRKELALQSRLALEQPQVVDYRFGHGQVLHNLGDLLRERGHPAEGLPLEREAVRQLEGLYRPNVKNPHYRVAYSYACWTLASMLVDLKDHRAAALAVAEYLGIEPNGFEESFESVGFLCRCAELCRNDPGVPEKERAALARTYADRAMDALRTAVKNGFRDTKVLQSAVTYELLRSRDDFRQVVREIEILAQPTGKPP
jgi:eukaryotic-like serine/threonine-protein kinase